MQFDLRAQDGQQALVLPRLLDEVARAAAHGFDRQSDVAPRRHDDDRQCCCRGRRSRRAGRGLPVRRWCRACSSGRSAPRRRTRWPATRAPAPGDFAVSTSIACGTKQQLERFQNVRLVIGREDAPGRGVAPSRAAIGGVPGFAVTCVRGKLILPQRRDAVPPHPESECYYLPASCRLRAPVRAFDF